MSNSERKLIRGEKHHWWPKSLSNFWTDDKGLVHRIDAAGKIIPSKPKEFGSISDGHNLLFSKKNSWESTIEDYFDRPDRSMPSVVCFFKSLSEREQNGLLSLNDNEKELVNLSKECLLSLLVRSPKYRNGISDLIESIRGKLPKVEAKSLISSNIHQKYKTLIKNSINRGKLVVLFSKEDEFVYGDGLFSNLTVNTQSFSDFYSLVPFTPLISLAWSVPREYKPKPEVKTVFLNREQVKLINDATQVYSKDYLFFRSQKPKLLEEFKAREHYQYKSTQNPISSMIFDFIQ